MLYYTIIISSEVFWVIVSGLFKFVQKNCRYSIWVNLMHKYKIFPNITWYTLRALQSLKRSPVSFWLYVASFLSSLLLMAAFDTTIGSILRIQAKKKLGKSKRFLTSIFWFVHIHLFRNNNLVSSAFFTIRGGQKR